MKNFLLKFNHGVEIGAALAYKGHYLRTLDDRVLQIMTDEVVHRDKLALLLGVLDDAPNPIIDGSFRAVGNVIKFLCRFAPLRSLDIVARVLEIFAVFSYRKAAKLYPRFKTTLLEMAECEDRHERFFAKGIDPTPPKKPARRKRRKKS